MLPCVEVNIKRAWSLAEMATLCTSAIGLDWDCDSMKDMDLTMDAFVARRLPSRRKVVALCISEVLASGEEVPAYRVGDNNWSALEKWVVARLQTLWPEFA